MLIYDNDDAFPLDSDAYSEAVASQEEIYLERTEEELRVILDSYDSSPLSNQLPDEQHDQAVEDLLVGDSDDPPLSQEAIEDLLIDDDRFGSGIVQPLTRKK